MQNRQKTEHGNLEVDLTSNSGLYKLQSLAITISVMNQINCSCCYDEALIAFVLHNTDVEYIRFICI
jgi:hypothetical protein